MGRIFLSAAHGGFENGARDPGTIAGGTTEAKEMGKHTMKPSSYAAPIHLLTSVGVDLEASHGPRGAVQLPSVRLSCGMAIAFVIATRQMHEDAALQRQPAGRGQPHVHCP